jgi:hypothetical protein
MLGKALQRDLKSRQKSEVIKARLKLPRELTGNTRLDVQDSTAPNG